MFDEKIKALSETIDIKEKNKRVYTVEEIMDILSVSKTTAYNLVNSGAFHCVKIGGHYRISKKSFDKWLDDIEEDTSECQVCE